MRSQWYVLLGALLIAFLLFGCVVNVQEQPSNQPASQSKNEGSGAQDGLKGKTYVITYVDEKTGETIKVLASTEDGKTYTVKSEGGSVNTIPSSSLKKVEEFSETSMRCCPCPIEQRCVEPEPEVLYLCSNQKVVSNIADCGVSCDQKAEKLVYVCGDGKEVTDPSLCGGISGVEFVCADGTIVNSAIQCGCANATYTAACTPSVKETRYKCLDGTITTEKELCGYGIVNKYFVCTDGRKVSQESDCSAVCQPTLATATAAPQNEVKTVYKCWNGLIVNSKGECPSYCNQGCVCPDYYKPVCGSDGKSYPNECYAKCAGVVKYTDGECQEYKCIKEGQECKPEKAVITHAPQEVCCPGLVCAQDKTKLSAVVYTCQQPQQPKEEPQPTCALEGQTCTVYKTATGAQTSTCCNGLMCSSNGVCVNLTKQWCKDSDNGKDQYTFGQTVYGTGDKIVEMEYDKCYEETNVVEYYCLDGVLKSTTIPCKSGEICKDGVCVKKGKECVYEYCANGVFYTSCSYNENSGECECSTKVKCDSGVCNKEGTACGSVEQTCPYEYCKDGVFYTGCNLNSNTGQCECTTLVQCTSGRCDSEGKYCASVGGAAAPSS